MGLELKGQVKEITDVETGTSGAGKDWSKLTFAIDYKDGDYDNVCAFTIFGQEKIDKFMESIDVGMDVTVKFNARSRKPNDKWYTDLQAWKVEAGE